jgi:hypothetical protein
MKHIRMFEGFRDDYYVKIDYMDFFDLTEESSEGYDCLLTDREKLWIEKNLPIEYWQYSNHEDIVSQYVKDLKTTAIPRDIAIGVSAAHGSGGFRFVYKIEDDYFVCSLNEEGGITYYKCDQFEGFIKLLTDKNVI